MSARQPGHMPMCTHTEAIRQRLPLFLSLFLFYRLSSQKRAGLAGWLAGWPSSLEPVLPCKVRVRAWTLGFSHGCQGVKPRSLCRHLSPISLTHQILQDGKAMGSLLALYSWVTDLSDRTGALPLPCIQDRHNLMLSTHLHADTSLTVASSTFLALPCWF